MSPTTKGALIVGAGLLVIGGGITAAVMLSKPKAGAPPGGKGPAGPGGAKPGGPTKVVQVQWIAVAPDATTQALTLQAGSTYAISIPAADAMLPAIAGALPKSATRSPAGNTPPAGFPPDGRGTSAFRAIVTPGAMLAFTVSRNTLAWLQKIRTVVLEPI